MGRHRRHLYIDRTHRGGPMSCGAVSSRAPTRPRQHRPLSLCQALFNLRALRESSWRAAAPSAMRRDVPGRISGRYRYCSSECYRWLIILDNAIYAYWGVTGNKHVDIRSTEGLLLHPHPDPCRKFVRLGTIGLRGSCSLPRTPDVKDDMRTMFTIHLHISGYPSG